MKRASISLSVLACLLTLIAGSSCVQQAQVAPAPAVVAPVVDAYELFVRSHSKYPATMAIYRNRELMKKATSSSPIYICLSQQRGRLYVDGQVAADWPVSTGTASRPTPTGSFRVLEKKRSYRSRTWGRMYSAEGRCVNSNADARRGIPEGARFVGANMPNWQRLTGSGIGMHTGKVRAGQRLSHGCIRTPGVMARELFSITSVGTHVTVTSGVESCYPSFHATSEQIEQAKLTAKKPATAAATPAPIASTPSESATVSQNQPTAAQQQPGATMSQQQPGANVHRYEAFPPVRF